MSLRKGLVFAMEEGLADEVSEEVVPASELEVERGDSEITENSNDIEEMVTATEEAVADAESLGEIQDVMQESVDEGEGLPEEAAEIAEVAVESICRRLGISNTKIIPAMESFGSKHSRLSATKIAIESIGDTLKKIWEAIKAAFIRVWDKIKTFFIGFTKNTQALSNHLDDLKKRVIDLEDSKTADKDLDSSSLANAFSINKKANHATATTIIENSKKLLEANADLTKTVDGTLSGLKNLMSTEIDRNKFTAYMNSAQAAHDANIRKILSSIIISGIGKAQKEDKKNATSYAGPFEGCRVLRIQNQTKGTAPDEYKVFSIGIETSDKFEAEKIDVLKKDQMLDLIHKAASLIDALNSFEKQRDMLSKAADASKKVADEALKVVAKLSENDTVKSRIFREIGTEVSSYNSIVSSMSVSIPKVVFDAIKSSANYVSASIAAHKKKSKD